MGDRLDSILGPETVSPYMLRRWVTSGIEAAGADEQGGYGGRKGVAVAWFDYPDGTAFDESEISEVGLFCARHPFSLHLADGHGADDAALRRYRETGEWWEDESASDVVSVSPRSRRRLPVLTRRAR